MPRSGHGMHGRITAHPDERDALARILWATEVWRSDADRDAELAKESVLDLIAKARSLIAGGAEPVRTISLGGKGLSAR